MKQVNHSWCIRITDTKGVVFSEMFFKTRKVLRGFRKTQHPVLKTTNQYQIVQSFKVTEIVYEDGGIVKVYKKARI